MTSFTARVRGQRGASLVELTVVLPTLLVGTLAIWQSALLFHAKSHLNYAAFEAARAGSLAHASVDSAMRGLARGLVAYHGGGLTTAELAQRLAHVEADVRAGARVEVLSPVIESFDDYASPALRERLGAEARVIPNTAIAFQRCPHDRPQCNADPASNASGQSLQDANCSSCASPTACRGPSNCPWWGVSSPWRCMPWARATPSSRACLRRDAFLW